jgi:hypothetical protein
MAELLVRLVAMVRVETGGGAAEEPGLFRGAEADLLTLFLVPQSCKICKDIMRSRTSRVYLTVTRCDARFYLDGVGCTACPAGTYALNTGASVCTCAAGTYKTASGNPLCATCDANASGCGDASAGIYNAGYGSTDSGMTCSACAADGIRKHCVYDMRD